MPDRIIPRLNGPRGSALLSGGLVAGMHAAANLGLFPIALPSGLQLLDRVVPLAFYGVLWLGAAVVALCGCWKTKRGYQHDRLDAAGFGIVCGLLAAWGATYFIGGVVNMVTGTPSGQFVYAMIYWAFAISLAANARQTNPKRSHP